MNILAIDTSTDLCSISLFLKDKIVDTYEEERVISHSKILASNVDLIMTKNDFKVSNLSLILLSIGPGSYSGLRVSSSFTKGLAFSIKKPIYPINTLEAMALNIADKNSYYVALYSHRNYAFYQEYFNGKKIDKQYCREIKNHKNINIYGYNLDKIEGIKSINSPPSSVNLINYFLENKEQLEEKDIADINPIYLDKS